MAVAMDDPIIQLLMQFLGDFGGNYGGGNADVLFGSQPSVAGMKTVDANRSLDTMSKGTANIEALLKLVNNPEFGMFTGTYDPRLAQESAGSAPQVSTPNLDQWMNGSAEQQEVAQGLVNRSMSVPVAIRRLRTTFPEQTDSEIQGWVDQLNSEIKAFESAKVSEPSSGGSADMGTPWAKAGFANPTEQYTDETVPFDAGVAAEFARREAEAQRSLDGATLKRKSIKGSSQDTYEVNGGGDDAQDYSSRGSGGGNAFPRKKGLFGADVGGSGGEYDVGVAGLNILSGINNWFSGDRPSGDGGLGSTQQKAQDFNDTHRRIPADPAAVAADREMAAATSLLQNLKSRQATMRQQAAQSASSTGHTPHSDQQRQRAMLALAVLKSLGRG